MKQKSIIWPLAFLALIVIWGTQFYFIKIGLNNLSPFFAASLRFLIVFFVGHLICKIKGWKFNNADHWHGQRLIFNISKSANIALVYYAHVYLASAITGTLSLSAPFFTILLAHFFITDDKITWQTVFAMTLGATGVAIMIFFQSDVNSLHYTVIGFVAMLLSQFSIAVNQIAAKKLVAEINPFVLLRDMGFSAFLVTFIFWVLEFPTLSSLKAPVMDYAIILYLALFNTLIATAIYYALLKNMKLSRISYLKYATAITAILVGVFINDEKLAVFSYAGIGLFVIGTILITRSSEAPQKAEIQK